jgi:hypothetical protein
MYGCSSTQNCYSTCLTWHGQMGTGHRSTGSCIARICLDHVIARGLPLRKLIPILPANCGQLRFGKLTERCGKSQKVHVISSFPLGHDLLSWWFFHIFRFFKPSLSRMERCGYCSQPVSRANCCSRWGAQLQVLRIRTVVWSWLAQYRLIDN